MSHENEKSSIEFREIDKFPNIVALLKSLVWLMNFMICENILKKSGSSEQDLCMKLTFKQSKKLAQLRTSSHKFNIETGRHDTLCHKSPLNRICFQCCDEDTVTYLAELPFSEPVNEDAENVLRECGVYNNIRESLSQDFTFLQSDHVAKNRSYILEGS